MSLKTPIVTYGHNYENGHSLIISPENWTKIWHCVLMLFNLGWTTLIRSMLPNDPKRLRMS